MSTVYTLEGEKGSGKSSFGLTIPGKLAIIDLEYGADRATVRLGGEVVSDKSDSDWIILRHEKYVIYRLKPDINKMYMVKGDLVQGQIENWELVTKLYRDLLPDDEFATIQFDTHKELWTINHRSELQRKQELQIADQRIKLNKPQMSDDQVIASLSDFRQQLLPVEYATPNQQMQAMINMARVYEKNLVLVNHRKDMYISTIVNGRQATVASGQKELDGWKGCLDLTDWGFIMSMSPPKFKMATYPQVVETPAVFHAQITKSPVGAHLMGMTINDPTYEKLRNLTKALGGQ